MTQALQYFDPAFQLQIHEPLRRKPIRLAGEECVDPIIEIAFILMQIKENVFDLMGFLRQADKVVHPARSPILSIPQIAASMSSFISTRVILRSKNLRYPFSYSRMIASAILYCRLQLPEESIPLHQNDRCIPVLPKDAGGDFAA